MLRLEPKICNWCNGYTCKHIEDCEQCSEYFKPKHKAICSPEIDSKVCGCSTELMDAIDQLRMRIEHLEAELEEARQNEQRPSIEWGASR
jgi:regulator of replication initiation timing